MAICGVDVESRRFLFFDFAGDFGILDFCWQVNDLSGGSS
jgi:hypothetical protein